MMHIQFLSRLIQHVSNGLVLCIVRRLDHIFHKTHKSCLGTQGGDTFDTIFHHQRMDKYAEQHADKQRTQQQ